MRTRATGRRRQCLNPRCLEELAGGRLCPSCAFVGRYAFALGSLIAGAITWWIK